MSRYKVFWRWLVSKFRELANIREDTDVQATIDSIKKSVEFRGPNVWMLAFAIIVASVGLNVNSTAVIIGAMLISPLMGPINGIGLAVGTMDLAMFRHSVKNLGVMVLISLLASTTYFLITPLSDAQSELLARTTPTIYDVFIAFFGGAAGILALSRKAQAITTISGVAIATALMPPLCTAGFGLASAQWSYFFGAFYLFFINSFFIATATFLMVRYLHFPAAVYVDERKQKFVTAIQNDVVYKDVEVVSNRREFSRKEQKIYISFVGKTMDDVQVQHLYSLQKDYGLQNAKLEIKQLGGSTDIQSQNLLVADLLERKEVQLAQKDSTIQQLENELSKIKNATSEFKRIAAEMKVQYPEIVSFSVANAVYTKTDDLEQDTIPVLFIHWSEMPEDKTVSSKVKQWMQVRLSVPNLELRETVAEKMNAPS